MNILCKEALKILGIWLAVMRHNEAGNLEDGCRCWDVIKKEKWRKVFNLHCYGEQVESHGTLINPINRKKPNPTQKKPEPDRISD